MLTFCVVFIAQSEAVFEYMSGDFMKPVVDTGKFLFSFYTV